MSQKTSLEGRTVTFAGKFKVARDTVKAEAEAAGCRITGAVSGSTDILVLGAGVEVWTEDQFRATLLSAVGGGGCGWGGGGGGKKGAGKRAADAGSKGPPAKKAKDRAVAGAAGAGTKVKKGHLREQLREAVESGNATEVRTLLVQGADMDTPGADGVTPAQEAASCNHCEVLKALIEAGADVNKANKFNGYTPAHTAVTRNSMLALKALVDAGADMNAVDKCGRTPAHFAANLGRSDTLKLLIDAGADASKADKCGQTPAHFAANIGHSDTIKVLIDAGADMVKVDKDGKSPFDLAGFPQGPVSFRTAANAESRAKVLQLLRAHDSRQWWASP